MMRFAHFCSGGDDRCLVEVRGARLLLGVADGAGGTGRGALAADRVLQQLRAASDDVDPAELLRQCDRELAPSGGETTAVIVVVDDLGLRGASVGDSGAWWIESAVELTEHQERKPLLGSGRATPISFRSAPLAGTLLLASDGLLKYAPIARIRQLASLPELDAIPEQLLAAVRLPSGRLPDDVSVIVCRP